MPRDRREQRRANPSSIHRGCCSLRRLHCLAGSVETGQSMILIIGYVAIVLLAVSATLAATLVNTEARKLLSVADSAATAAADSFEVESTGGKAMLQIRLSDAGVAAAASKYVSDVAASRHFDGFSITRAEASGDGTTAVIALEAVVRPPIVGWIVPGGIPVSVESRARTGLTR